MTEFKHKQPQQKQQQQQQQRRQMVQGVQRDYLLNAMKELLNTNKKQVHKKQIWENISNELNKLGPSKEPARWRKCWSDLLLRLRKRILQQQDKYQISSLNDKNCYKNLKLSPDDIKILNCYGGIESLFKDCNRKTKDGKIETISIADSSDNEGLSYDNQDDSQLSFTFNNNTNNNNNNNNNFYHSSPKPTLLTPTVIINEQGNDIIKMDIPTEIYDNNNINNNNNNTKEIYEKNSRIIDDQMIVKSINTNPNHMIINQQDSSRDSTSNHNNEMNQSNVIADHVKESLEIQKQTFEEIRRLGVIQQETNNLIRILINRLTPSTPTITDNHENIMTEIHHPQDENHLSMLSVKLEEIVQNGPN